MNRRSVPLAVLFDWDNTLVDNWHVIRDAINATLSAMGHPTWTLEETKRRVRASLRDSFPQMFGDRWPEARETYYRAFAARHLEALAPMPGADALLRDLERRRIPCGIVSNKHGQYLRAEVDHLGWSPLFGGIVGAGDCARDKPARDPIDRALSLMGLAADSGRNSPQPDVWFVGDTDIDILCARNGGCWPVLVRGEAPREGEFGDMPPALHVPDCGALQRFIETM